MTRSMGRAVAAALALFLFLPLRSAGAASYGENLIVNGGAEAGSTSGWIQTGEYFAVYPPASPIPSPYSPEGGNLFDFFPEKTAATGSLSQEIDLSGLAADIDTGRVALSLTALARRYGQDTQNLLRLELMDAKEQILALYSCGGTPEAAAQWETLNIAEDPTVQGTRRLRVTLLASVAKAFSGGYAEFDGVSLVLTRQAALLRSAGVSGLIAPVAGALPTDAAGLTPAGTGYTVAGLTWLNKDGTEATLAEGRFMPNTLYLAQISLAAAFDFRFPAQGLFPSVNVGWSGLGAAGGGAGEDSTLTFTVSFAATGAQ